MARIVLSLCLPLLSSFSSPTLDTEISTSGFENLVWGDSATSIISKLSGRYTFSKRRKSFLGRNSSALLFSGDFHSFNNCKIVPILYTNKLVDVMVFIPVTKGFQSPVEAFFSATRATFTMYPNAQAREIVFTGSNQRDSSSVVLFKQLRLPASNWNGILVNRLPDPGRRMANEKFYSSLRSEFDTGNFDLNAISLFSDSTATLVLANSKDPDHVMVVFTTSARMQDHLSARPSILAAVRNTK